MPNDGFRPVLARWPILRRLFGLEALTKRGAFGPRRRPTAAADLLFGRAGPISRRSPLGLWYYQMLEPALDRRWIYDEDDDMDRHDIVASGLDIYAENSTQIDVETGLTVWVESGSEEIKNDLTAMFARIGLEDKLFAIVRLMAKYGSVFLMPFLQEDKIEKGIQAVEVLPPDVATRVEERGGTLVGFAPGIVEDRTLYKHDPKSGRVEIQNREELLKPWDLVQFRLLAGRQLSRHGDSILDPVRYTWRQLRMAEDAVNLYRIESAPDILLFKIDVGDMSPEDEADYLQRWEDRIMERISIDPQQGSFNREYRPKAVGRSLFLPVRQNSMTTMEKFAGSANIADIEDLNYLRNKMFAGLRIPKAYMGFEEAGVGGFGRATLAAQDVQFARSVKRLQRALLVGLHRLCQIHLAWRGIDPFEPDKDFKLRMNPISFLDESQRAELINIRMNVVDRLLAITAQAGLYETRWARYVLKKYLGLTDKELSILQRPQEEVQPAAAPFLPSTPLGGPSPLSSEFPGATPPPEGPESPPGVAGGEAPELPPQATPAAGVESLRAKIAGDPDLKRLWEALEDDQFDLAASFFADPGVGVGASSRDRVPVGEEWKMPAGGAEALWRYHEERQEQWKERWAEEAARSAT